MGTSEMFDLRTSIENALSDAYDSGRLDDAMGVLAMVGATSVDEISDGDLLDVYAAIHEFAK